MGENINNGQGILFVIEDDPNIATILNIFLTKKGYEVIIAMTGYEAVKRYDALREKNTKIHKILLDQILPDANGLIVLENIVKKYALPREYVAEKVIFTSGNLPQDAANAKNNSLAEDAKRIGIKYFSPKPFYLDELLNLIKNQPTPCLAIQKHDPAFAKAASYYSNIQASQ